MSDFLFTKRYKIPVRVHRDLGDTLEVIFPDNGLGKVVIRSATDFLPCPSKAHAYVKANYCVACQSILMRSPGEYMEQEKEIHAYDASADAFMSDHS